MHRKSHYGTPGKPVHTCVGVYPDGSCVINGVLDKDLDANVEYNRTFRPGRYYFVDGEYVCGGIMRDGPEKEAKIAELTALLERKTIPEQTACTRPYQ